MSRFILTQFPSALPGSCFVCGSASREMFVDFGMSVEFHGALYICVDKCIAEMANLAGYADPEFRKRLENELAENSELVFEQQLKISGLERAVHGLLDYRGVDGSFSAADYDAVLRDAEPKLEQSSGSNSGSKPDSFSKLTNAAARTSESSNGKNMAGIRTDSDSTDFNLG